MAEYMTHSQLQQTPDVVAERDFAFGMKQPEIAKVEKEEMVNVQMKLLAVRTSDGHHRGLSLTIQ